MLNQAVRWADSHGIRAKAYSVRNSGCQLHVSREGITHQGIAEKGRRILSTAWHGGIQLNSFQIFSKEEWP